MSEIRFLFESDILRTNTGQSNKTQVKNVCFHLINITGNNNDNVHDSVQRQVKTVANRQLLKTQTKQSVKTS